MHFRLSHAGMFAANFCFNGYCVSLSFPLVGNPSEGKERFWASQNDKASKVNRETESA
jgi:hypothetical protein